MQSMSANRKTQQIPLAQLVPGMFVVELDIPWMQSPFFKHSRMIASGHDINKLRSAGVKLVTIDLERGSAPQEVACEPVNVLTGTQPLNDSELQVPPQTHDLSPGFKKELAVALRLRSEVKDTVRSINEKLERNLPVDGEAMAPLVDKTLESLQRNEQALQTLAHLTGKAQKLVDHAFGSFCLCLNLAVVTGLAKEEMHALGVAALLHDSGWMQLPLHLMGKRSDYTAAERSLAQSHVELGLRMLDSANIDALTRRIIAEHHEMNDGSGYPKQLKGYQIHPASHILTVVNTYDEWVHHLNDKPGMLPTKALRVLYMHAEKGRFALPCVASLISMLGVYPVTTAVRLNTGEKAVVEEINPNSHLTPVIRIEYDSNSRPLRSALRVDLSMESANERSITGVLDPSSPDDDPARRLVATVPG